MRLSVFVEQRWRVLFGGKEKVLVIFWLRGFVCFSRCWVKNIAKDGEHAKLQEGKDISSGQDQMDKIKAEDQTGSICLV